MERLLNPEQFDQLTAAAAQRGAKNQSAHFMPDELAHLTAKGALWYDEIPQGVLFWKPNGVYTLLSLFVDPQSEFTIPPSDLPIVAGFIGAGSLPKRFLPVIERLKACGFRDGFRGKRMSIATDALHASLLGVKDWAVAPAELRHKDEILQLWADNFDFVECLIPSEEELIEYIEAGGILRAYTDRDETAGIVLIEYLGGAGWMRHQAVVPDFRGKKVGMSLTCRFSEIMMAKGPKRCCHWVDVNAEPAIRFHQKAGYDFDGKVYESYIL